MIELDIEEPSLEACSISYIKYLSQRIVNWEENIFDLAYEIYNIVASPGYPEELIEWFEISEMIDAVENNVFYGEYYTKQDVEEQ